MAAGGLVCMIQVQEPSGGPGPEKSGNSSGCEAGVIGGGSVGIFMDWRIGLIWEGSVMKLIRVIGCLHLGHIRGKTS